MASSAWRLWALVALIAVGAAIFWLSPERTRDGGPQPLPTGLAAPPAPLLEGWERPAAALLLSGEQFGYLEPCGCSITQSGGLARRARLEAMLREKGWPIAGLDAGDTLKHSRRQDQIKFDAILSGLKQLNYAAVAAGTSELRLGPDYLLQPFTEVEGVPFGGMLVSANVVFFDTPTLGVPKPWKTVNVGDVKIGVTAVLGQQAAAEVAPAGVQTNITVTPAAEALAAVLPQIKAESPDFLVLLSHGTTDEAKTLAQSFPEFAIVLTTGGAEEPPEKPTRIGETLVLQVGHKGKHIGVLGYYPDASEKFQWEVVNLDNQRFENDPRMNELMRSYQQQLQDLAIAEQPDLVIPHSTGRTFVGAEKCGECHKNAYKTWKATKHAQAFHSLERGRKGQEHNWVSRVYDPECLACHVTGWNPQEVRRYDSGYLNAASTPHLMGQQCENCHGPGSDHSDQEWRLKDQKLAPDEAAINARKDVKRFVATAEKEVCIKCHDGDNSPAFNFKEYWEKVKHPFKD
jgi:nitrate reductase cytochrome c-type subunit